MVPHHLYGGDEELLVGAMDAAEGGAHAYHVHSRELLTEETTLQSCMDAANDGLLAEELLVLLNRDAEYLAVGVHLPSGIAFADLHPCSCQLEDCCEGVGHVDASAVDAASLAAVHVDGLCCRHFVYACQVAACLDEVEVLTLGKDAVVNALQGADEPLAAVLVDGTLGLLLALEGEGHRLLCDAVLLLNVCLIEIPIYGDALLVFHGNGTKAAGFAWDGVVQAASLDVNQAEVVLLLAEVEEAGQQFVGICALLIDVVAAVTAGQALYGEREGEEACRQRLFGVVELSERATASCAGDKDFSLVFAVEVDQQSACHEVGLHSFCSGEAGLFVAGEDAFQRTMLDVGGFQQSHLHGHTDAIVGAKRGALCLHPLSVHVSLNGVLCEIECDVAVLLADHIHVTLQYDGLTVLHAGRGRLADDDVARFVASGVEVQFASEVEQEVDHLLFLFRRTGYLVHLCKALEYTLGLKVIVHNALMFILCLLFRRIKVFIYRNNSLFLYIIVYLQTNIAKDVETRTYYPRNSCFICSVFMY